MRPARASSVHAIVTVALAAVLVVHLARVGYHGIEEVIERNDFEVFHHVGEVARTHEPIIYEVQSPQNKRGPFLYPPSAAVLFVPLTSFSHDAAGAAFSIVKVIGLALLYWFAVRLSGAAPKHLWGALAIIVGTAVVLYRPVDSDVGNGQINIIIAAMAVGGVWIVVKFRWLWWLGGILLSVAIAIKLTPALLAAVFLLHRRWQALALTAITSAVLLLAMPMAWFGPKPYEALAAQHREITARFTFDWPARDAQHTLTELLQFVRVGRSPQLLVAGREAEERLPITISGRAGRNLLAPEDRSAAVMFWMVCGVLVGIAFLAGRSLLGRAGGPPWHWDLAMLCCLTVLLAPRVQKAHLVILIVPVAWVAARLFREIAAMGLSEALARRPLVFAASALAGVLFLAAEDLPIPAPGLTHPLRAGMLLALLITLGLLIALLRDDCKADAMP